MKRIVSYASSILMIVVLANAGICQQDDDMKFKSRHSYINLEVVAEDVFEKDKITGIAINKSAEALDSRLKFVYEITTPPVDDFNFVLALDSSCSLKTSPNSRQAEAVIDAVPKFIAGTIDKYPKKNFNISIVSWDEDIDFAYYDLGNNKSNRAKLVPIQNASDDLKSGVFERGKIDDKNYSYYCLGDESTNLSLALEASMDILKNNPSMDNYNTSRFIILVVGEGELIDDFNNSIIEEAKNSNFSIYAILMNPTDKSDLLDHLMYVTNNKTQSCQAPGEELAELLKLDLEDALKSAISEPAATNVTLVEYVYSFCKPDNTAMIEIKSKSRELDFKDIEHINITKDLESHVISMTFPISRGIYGDSITTVTYYANTSFEFPGTVSDIRASSLNYTWLKKNNYTIAVPGNNIRMQSFPILPEPDKDNPNIFLGILVIIIIIVLITAIIKLKNRREL